MKKSLKRILAFVMCAVLLMSAMGMTALAAPGEGGGEGGAPGGAPGGMPGGAPGGQSSAIDLTGMLALEQYVFEGAVSTECYGVYAAGGKGSAAFVPVSFKGDIQVFLDKDLKVEAEGVSAVVSDGKFTMKGTATEGNVVYYLTTGAGAYTTTIYVVNDQYDKNSATLTLADGTSVELTKYAPNMANGDYTATVDAANAAGSVYIGGNRTIRTAADYGITGDDATAVNWFLSSGITNAGKSLSEFGDEMYGFEYAVAMYRMFQIVIEENLLAADFKYPTDSQGGMGSNDQYSDAVDAILHAGILNGLYTEESEVKNKGGIPLIKNLEGSTATTFGATEAVNAEFAFVALYNAFVSRWTMLNAKGEAIAEQLKAAKAETNADKMAALATALNVTVPENGKMSKIDVVKLLYAASGYIQSKTSPDETLEAKTGSAYSNMLKLHNGEFYKTPIVAKQSDVPDSLTSAEGSAALVNNAGKINIKNKTVSLTGNSDKVANYIAKTTDENVLIDGAEAAMGTSDVGFVYNATMRNAFYREGIGSAMAIWGKTSVVNLTSDNGTLVIDGEASGSSYPAGTMAGTVYVGFGGTLNVTNAVAYSAGQHLTNILYNGSVHFKNAAAFASGRVYSSDFWGGYEVFENSIATGGSVTDEPTTLIVKNSVYGNSVGGNGFASQYFENSVLNVGTASFQNTTSLITDTGALTLVNSKMNSSSATFASTTKGERAIITLVDSDIDLSQGNVIAKVDNWQSLNNKRTGFSDNGMFNGELVIDLKGENTIITSDGTLKATVADGAKLTIKGSVVDENGKAITIPGATIVAGEGKLVVKSAKPESKFEDVAADAWYAEAVDYVTSKEIFKGTSDTTFSPESETSRAMLATVIYRLAGSPKAGACTFKDVEAGKWYTDAIAWAAESGVVTGYSAEKFGPMDKITREQMATMLYRYAIKCGYDVSVGEDTNIMDYDDVKSISSYAVSAIQWAVGAGIMQGTAKTTMSPQNTATRAEVATILMRFCKVYS